MGRCAANVSRHAASVSRYDANVGRCAANGKRIDILWHVIYTECVDRCCVWVDVLVQHVWVVML